MNETIQSFLRLFFICLGASVLCGAFSCILVRRRNWWLRFMDLEESFWLRFGLPRGGLFRKFGESRFFTISFIVFAVFFFLLALACLGFYFYFRQRADAL